MTNDQQNDIGPLTKQCGKCLQYLPATTEYFRLIKRTGALHSPCKRCVAERTRTRKLDPVVKNAKREYDRSWRTKNKETFNTRFRERYKNDPVYRSKRKQAHKKNRQLHPEIRRIYQRTSFRARFGHYRKGAQMRGIVFELTIQDFMSFWQKSCYYCDAPILTIGLDRIDNQKGYVLDNVVSCCKVCNRMKSNLTQGEWLSFIGRIYNKVIANQGGVSTGA